MKEYKNKTLEDLKKLINEKRVAIRDFRFGSSGSKTKNVKLAGNLKKDIARIMTEITMRKNSEIVK